MNHEVHEILKPKHSKVISGTRTTMFYSIHEARAKAREWIGMANSRGDQVEIYIDGELVWPKAKIFT